MNDDQSRLIRLRTVHQAVRGLWSWGYSPTVLSPTILGQTLYHARGLGTQGQEDIRTWLDDNYPGGHGARIDTHDREELRAKLNHGIKGLNFAINQLEIKIRAQR